MVKSLPEQLARIKANIEEAQQRGKPIWPLNEVDTERIVVEPILEALGYGPLDYRKQVQGVGANYPDYLILPGSDQRWVLEAKEWDLRLDERWERQAVNYANNNGAQWAVLTNGRTWWVYNTRVPGDLSQQRVHEIADICDADVDTEFLAYLSRTSIEDGELDRVYRAREIRTAVLAELMGRNRQILKAIRDAVRRSLDRNVELEDVSGALTSLLDARVQSSPPAAKVELAKAEAVAVPAEPGWVPLADLAADASRCTRQKPAEVRLGSVEPSQVTTWCQVAEIVLRSPGVLDRLQLPFRAGPRSERYFLSYEARHPDGKEMRAPHELDHNGRRVYVEMHYSAKNLLAILASVLRAAGADPASVSIWLAASNTQQDET